MNPSGADILNSNSQLWWRRQEHSAGTAEPESKAAFYAVLAFTLVLLLSPQSWFPVLGKLRIAFLCAGAAGALLLWDRFHRRAPLITFNSEVIVALLLPIWAFLTVPISYWPGGSFEILTDLYVKAVAIFWLLANVITTLPRLRLTAVALMLCSVPLAFTGVKNFITGKFIGGGQAVVRVVGYRNALAMDPNDLALMLNLILPLSIALFLSSTRPMHRAFCGAVISLSVLAVILTFSRAGFLGLATVGAIYVARLVKRPGSDRPWAYAAITVALVALPLLPAEYLNRIRTITNIEADETRSAQERWAGTVAAIRAIKDNPVAGAGIGMDILALNELGGPAWHHVHNVYLQYGVDLGIPGLVLFLFLLRGVLRKARAARRRAAGSAPLRPLFVLAEGLEISLVVFAVEGLFHPVAYHFYFYYMGGLALALTAVTSHTIAAVSTSRDESESALSMAPLRRPLPQLA